MKSNIRNRKKQGGFTLLELMVVLVIFVLLGAGIYAMFGTTRAGTITDQATKGAMGIVAAINRVYPSPNYVGLTPASVANQAPKNLVVDGTPKTLRDPWGGTIAVAPSGATNNAYSITFPQVPTTECLPFVKSLQSNFNTVSVAGTEVKPNGGSLNEATATTQCNSAATVAVLMTGA